MNMLAFQLPEHLRDVPMRVPGRPPGKLAAPMESLRVRHTDLNPRRHPARQVANDHRRFVAGSDAFGEGNPFGAPGDARGTASACIRPSQTAAWPVASQGLHAPIDVGELGFEGIDRRAKAPSVSGAPSSRRFFR
jgi:hypothetical protein